MNVTSKDSIIQQLNYFYDRHDFPLWENQYLIDGTITHYEDIVRSRIQDYDINKDSLVKRIFGLAPKHPFKDIPLCWIGPHPEGQIGLYVKVPKGKTWYLLLGFDKRDNSLYGVALIYHSVPPELCLVHVDEIPKSVLAEALTDYQKIEHN